MEFNYREIRREAWRLTKDNSHLFIMSAIMCVIGAVLNWCCGEWITYSLRGMMKTEAELAIKEFLLLPMQYTFYVACLRVADNREKLPWWEVFAAYIKHPKQSWLLPLVKKLIVTVIGVFTLGIGGIIVAYAYSMVFYIADEHPDMSIDNILSKSSSLVKGYKWKIFVLDLAFVGWLALAVVVDVIVVTLSNNALPSGDITLLGMIIVSPYWRTARALMYKQLCTIQTAEISIEAEVTEVTEVKTVSTPVQQENVQ